MNERLSITLSLDEVEMIEAACGARRNTTEFERAALRVHSHKLESRFGKVWLLQYRQAKISAEANKPPNRTTTQESP